jgi:hypothetical protein
MIELPVSVRRLFIAAGWHPGRTSSQALGVSLDHPAAAILAEFGGLHVGQSGTGEECATSDVAFKHLRPEEFVLNVWGKLLATELVGIAEVQNRHAELYVDRSGRCFSYSNVDDGFRFEGSSFSAAIERLLLGRCSLGRCFAQSSAPYGTTARRSAPTTSECTSIIRTTTASRSSIEGSRGLPATVRLPTRRLPTSRQSARIRALQSPLGQS